MRLTAKQIDFSLQIENQLAEEMGLDVPVVSGIMPIINYQNLVRFSDSCRAEIPLWLRKLLGDFGDDADFMCAFVLQATTQLCRALLEQGAPGVHSYSMNRAAATQNIWKDLTLEFRRP